MAGNLSPDPLANLRDIHQPEAVSGWPLAPGWWLLLVSVLVLLGLGIWLYKRHRRNRYRRAASALLQASYQQWQQSADSQAYLLKANQLMKQCLMQQGLRREIASSSGQDWLQLMAQAAPKLQCPHYAAAVATQYQTDAAENLAIAAMHNELQAWIRQHRADLIRAASSVNKRAAVPEAASAATSDQAAAVKSALQQPVVSPSGREVNHA